MERKKFEKLEHVIDSLSNLQKQFDKIIDRLNKKTAELKAEIEQLGTEYKRKLLEGDTEGASMIVSQVIQLIHSLRLLETYTITAITSQIEKIEGLKKTVGLLPELSELELETAINQLEDALLSIGRTIIYIDDNNILSSEEKISILESILELIDEIKNFLQYK